jgi:CheY-like chemotaxis protein
MLGLLKKTRLLVLDDDPAMQRLITTLLRRKGYRVDVVSDAGQAMEKIGGVDYAALLLDVMTPTQGGATVIRELKQNKPHLLKRVILVTGSPASLLKSLAQDAAAVVQKPFDADDLVKAVARVAGK